jgi:hypothetical protein
MDEQEARGGAHLTEHHDELREGERDQDVAPEVDKRAHG